MTAPLPAGIAAFLLTDVEGSMRAWNECSSAMEAAVSQLDSDVALTVAAHNGRLIKARGEGDSHFAAFAFASDAVAAAAALQRRADQQLAVRACVVVGEARPRHGDYLGQVVNTGARIRSVAHGGQVVVTRAVVDVAADQVADDLSFRSLGSHRIRDVTEAVELFQLCGPDLRRSFPPLQTPAFTASALMAVVFVDEVDARHHFETHGSTVEWQRELIRRLRALCERHDGRHLKFLGDGCAVGFEDPRAALAFAADVHAVARWRIGVAMGLVEVVEGELSGRPILEASSLVRRAAAGETRCCPAMEEVCARA